MRHIFLLALEATERYHGRAQRWATASLVVILPLLLAASSCSPSSLQNEPTPGYPGEQHLSLEEEGAPDETPTFTIGVSAPGPLLIGAETELKLLMDGNQAPDYFECIWSIIDGDGEIAQNEGDCSSVYRAPDKPGKVVVGVFVNEINSQQQVELHIVPPDFNIFILDASKRMGEMTTANESYLAFARRSLVEDFLDYTHSSSRFALVTLGSTDDLEQAACEEQFQMIIDLWTQDREQVKTEVDNINKTGGEAPLKDAILILADKVINEILDSDYQVGKYRFIIITRGPDTCSDSERTWQDIAEKLQEMNSYVREAVERGQLAFIDSPELYILAPDVPEVEQLELRATLDSIRQETEIQAYLFSIDTEDEFSAIMVNLGIMSSQYPLATVNAYNQLGNILLVQGQYSAAADLFDSAAVYEAAQP